MKNAVEIINACTIATHPQLLQNKFVATSLMYDYRQLARQYYCHLHDRGTLPLSIWEVSLGYFGPSRVIKLTHYTDPSREWDVGSDLISLRTICVVTDTMDLVYCYDELEKLILAVPGYQMLRAADVPSLETKVCSSVELLQLRLLDGVIDRVVEEDNFTLTSFDFAGTMSPLNERALIQYISNFLPR